MPVLDAFVAHPRSPLAGLFERVSAGPRRVVVLYDRLRSFAAAEAARLRNGEAFCVQCVAVSYNGMVFHPVDACMPQEVAGRPGRVRPLAAWS
jgi:cis-zeatin O-glucosyltransferase